MALPDSDDLRREAIGAFVHEMRTPLTSLRMVLEIARRSSNGPGVTLDDELVTMVEDAVGSLQGLADALQESSRLERGKLEPARIPARLGDLLAQLQENAGGGVEVERNTGDIAGEWDVERLLTALSACVEAASRCGNGGSVRLVAEQHDSGCSLRFSSGDPQGATRPVNSDLGFGFFRASTLLQAMGATVDVDRSEGHCEIRVDLRA